MVIVAIWACNSAGSTATCDRGQRGRGGLLGGSDEGERVELVVLSQRGQFGDGRRGGVELPASSRIHTS